MGFFKKLAGALSGAKDAVITPKTVKLGIPDIRTKEQLGQFLGVSEKQIEFFIHCKRRAYKTFEIPKRNGGTRIIHAPCGPLKTVQRRILKEILYKVKVGDNAHGFVPGRTILTNAQMHTGHKIVLGIDLKDFFPTIKTCRVRGLFKSFGYSDEISTAFAELCTYKFRLPQGAPTSPTISNLITRRLDKRLLNFCNKRKLYYSRYADDITVSGHGYLPKYKKRIGNIIKAEGFAVNDDKTRILGRGSAQKVTGIIVNDKAGIGRKKKRILRAIVHNLEKKGPVAQNRDKDPFFRERLLGKLAFAKSIEPQFATPLILAVNNIDWSPYNVEYGAQRELKMNARPKKKLRPMKTVIAVAPSVKPDTITPHPQPMMPESSHCIECKSRLPDGAKRCPVCGKKT